MKRLVLSRWVPAISLLGTSSILGAKARHMLSWDPCCGLKIVLSAFSRSSSEAREWQQSLGVTQWPRPRPSSPVGGDRWVWMLLKPLQMGKQLFSSQVFWFHLQLFLPSSPMLETLALSEWGVSLLPVQKQAG